MRRKKFFALMTLILLSITVVLGSYFVTSERSFDERGQASSTDIIRIAVAGDGHWGVDGSDGVSSWERHRRMVNWLNAEAAKPGLDFVVFNGDLVHNNASWWVNAKGWYDKLNVPYYVTHGNHDSGSFSVWNQFWGMSYDYDFEYKGYGFVLLGTGTEYRSKPYSARLWNYNFLVERSEKYTKQNKPVFVITHISFDHPGYGGDYKGFHGPEAQKYHDYIRTQPLIRAAVFSHNHYRRGVRHYDGQAYFFTGSFSHRPEPDRVPPGYRIFEINIKTGGFTSYWVDGNTKVKRFSYTEDAPLLSPAEVWVVGIVSPVVGEKIVQGKTLSLKASDINAKYGRVAWAVRQGTCAVGTSTVAGNVDGYSNSFNWIDGVFTASLTTRRFDVGKYCFIFNPRDGGRYTREFSIVR